VPFVTASTSYKHQGFKEEREVRVVAIPASPQLVNGLASERRLYERPRTKEVRVRNGNRGTRRYIVLFEGLDAQLPIKRVIIGPSPIQEKNYDEARGLIQGDITLTRSATPFIG